MTSLVQRGMSLEPGDTLKRDNNLVAVITNGTAMLGLGNIGLLARKSVMPRLSSAITALQRPMASATA